MRLLTFFAVVVPALVSVGSIVHNVIGRQMEYQADRFSIEAGSEGCLKMFKERPAIFVEYKTHAYEMIHASHPSGPKRVRAMERVKRSISKRSRSTPVKTKKVKHRLTRS